ncbi:hypothetical protein GYMLUDRAFT_44006 [Collybiopsis luxurians FD-317 M1]|uniref:Nephrocystin 3-like N-terminal domain-containing protein n=1 Tax=Collybiopsis luxurians FD-317 M1 TaxID=944289 RepID=A0A0D0CBZ3_9AGAR|nr:hypothetical protein GYMLUDRAFT_44006 [Collybiopsis luxurians FD-317 M1]
MLNGSQDFTINGGTFNSVGGDMNIRVFEQRGEQGLATLYSHTSTSASYDAGARYPPPLCHPGTRESILHDLNQWASRSDQPDNPQIRWLYGPAGAGKSAIAQTFAQKCAENGTLLGSFFFWRSDPTRNNPHRLFTTIALQIAFAIPELRAVVNAAVTRNPFAPTSSFENQCYVLIIQLWMKVRIHQEFSYRIKHRKKRARSPSSRFISSSNKRPKMSGDTHGSVPDNSEFSFSTGPRVLVIDGLDECSSNNGEWQQILSILAQMVQKYGLPIQILVCSRPEPRIKESFAGAEFRNICRWMPLDDAYQASKDIRLFLVDGFKKILTCHSCSMAHVPRPWPSSEQIEYLVQKSSGQFIYASTVLKWISEDCDVPADRLHIVLGLQVKDHEGGNSPYAELDALYFQILSTVKKRNLFLQILAGSIVFRESDKITVISISDVLGHIPSGTLYATFAGVHSLFREPSPVESGFRFCHASFTDFLFDPRRSLQFHIDKSLGHDFLATIFFEDYFYLNLGNRQGLDWFHHCKNASGSDELISKLASIYTAISRRVELGELWYSVLPDLVSMMLQSWARFQAKGGQHSQELQDLCTLGFTLVVSYVKTEVYRKKCRIPIRYPSSWLSVINHGNSAKFFDKLEALLLSEVRKIITSCNMWEVKFHKIQPLCYSSP